MEHKIIYVFVKTDLLLDPGMTYRDAYDIEYERVPKTVVSTYLCGGLPLFDAVGGVGIGIPKPATSAQSHTRVSNALHPNVSAKPPVQMKISRMPLPTNAAKVGETTNCLKLPGYETEDDTIALPVLCSMLKQTLGADIDAL